MQDIIQNSQHVLDLGSRNWISISNKKLFYSFELGRILFLKKRK